MFIAIPTYGRANRQRTWANLPQELLEYTKFVVRPEELVSSRQSIVLPKHVKDIASTRQFIVEYAAKFGNTVIMVDDDLDFAVRRRDDPTRFTPADGVHLIKAFEEIENILKAGNFPHVGIACREGANRKLGTYIHDGRILRVHGFNLGCMLAERISFTPGMYMTDFDVTLQFLEAGHHNVCLNWIVQNQPGSNTPGGCSGDRTLEKLATSAEWLHSRHPDFVTLVKKFTKSSWGGNERTDVRIAWKKAYEYGRARRATEILDRGAGKDQDTEGNGGTQAVE